MYEQGYVLSHRPRQACGYCPHHLLVCGVLRFDPPKPCDCSLHSRNMWLLRQSCTVALWMWSLTQEGLGGVCFLILLWVTG